MDIKPHPEHRDATEVDVSHFEMSIGAKLPDDYRNFLLRHNGGYPKPNGFHGGAEVLNEFFGLWQKHADLNYELVICKRFIPPGTIPIGSDPCGNRILLEIAKPHRGRVWFWDHERSSKPQEAVFLLASSFSDFVDSLVDVEPGAA